MAIQNYLTPFRFFDKSFPLVNGQKIYPWTLTLDFFWGEKFENFIFGECIIKKKEWNKDLFLVLIKKNNLCIFFLYLSDVLRHISDDNVLPIICSEKYKNNMTNNLLQPVIFIFIIFTFIYFHLFAKQRMLPLATKNQCCGSGSMHPFRKITDPDPT